MRSPSWIANRLHASHVLHQRSERLAEVLAPLLPDNGRVLDVGAGDGLLARRIQIRRPDLSILGIDTLVRPDAAIPIRKFDGERIPYPSNSFDAVMAIDVLHHVTDAEALVREMKRVSSHRIVIKDHIKSGYLSGMLLRLMDWVGNAHHGVALPYNYLTKQEWTELWSELHLVVDHIDDDLKLYSGPFAVIGNHGLHLIVALSISTDQQTIRPTIR